MQMFVLMKLLQSLIKYFLLPLLERPLLSHFSFKDIFVQKQAWFYIYTSNT